MTMGPIARTLLIFGEISSSNEQMFSPEFLVADETDIPLLTTDMSEYDKLIAEDSSVLSSSSDSDASSNNEVISFQKVPWWSYIWVLPSFFFAAPHN
jgi:hypothetical protein